MVVVVVVCMIILISIMYYEMTIETYDVNVMFI